MIAKGFAFLSIFTTVVSVSLSSWGLLASGSSEGGQEQRQDRQHQEQQDVYLQPEATICAQSFNVYGPAYASSVESRVTRTAKALLQQPCEVIQLQELWREQTYRTFRDTMGPARMKIYHADELRSDDKKIGLVSAIAGDVKAATSRLFRVNNEDGVLDSIRDLTGVEKGYTVMLAQVKNAPPIYYVNLHTHPKNPAIRLAQMTQLLQDIFKNPKMADHPIVLTGDVNAKPDSAELGLLRDVLVLRDSYIEANKSYGSNGSVCTYCADNPLSWDNDSRVIDFVLLGNSSQYVLSSASSEINLKGDKSAPLSDHYGVKSMINITRAQDQVLDDQDPVVLARVSKARAALQAAIRGVLQERAQGFKEAAKYLGELDTALKNGQTIPVLTSLLRNPKR